MLLVAKYSHSSTGTVNECSLCSALVLEHNLEIWIKVPIKLQTSVHHWFLALTSQPGGIESLVRHLQELPKSRDRFHDNFVLSTQFLVLSVQYDVNIPTGLLDYWITGWLEDWRMEWKWIFDFHFTSTWFPTESDGRPQKKLEKLFQISDFRFQILVFRLCFFAFSLFLSIPIPLGK